MIKNAPLTSHTTPSFFRFLDPVDFSLERSQLKVFFDKFLKVEVKKEEIGSSSCINHILRV